MASDPLWGVGIGWALQSAEWLAEEAGPALGEERALDGALKRYARRHARRWPGTTGSARTTRTGTASGRREVFLPRRRPGRRAGRALRAVRRALDQAHRAAHPKHHGADDQGEPEPGRRSTGQGAGRRLAVGGRARLCSTCSYVSITSNRARGPSPILLDGFPEGLARAGRGRSRRRLERLPGRRPRHARRGPLREAAGAAAATGREKADGRRRGARPSGWEPRSPCRRA